MKGQMYSVDAERRYYETSPQDRRAVPYAHLDKYVAGSVGLGFFRGRRVLDVGAGEGTYSAWIADPQHGKATEVVGVELTEHRIRREYEKWLPNLRFVAGNIFEMEPDQKGFDAVFMNLVLHHLRFRLDDALQFMYLSLRPGGQFLAYEPNVYSPLAAIAHVLHGGSANEGFLTPRRIRRAMEQQGFRGVRVGYFWRSRWWAKNPLLASCFWITGTK